MGIPVFLIHNKDLRCVIVHFDIDKQVLETSSYINEYLPTMEVLYG